MNSSISDRKVLNEIVSSILLKRLQSSACCHGNPAINSGSRQLWLLRLFKGEQTADKLRVLLGVEPGWLEAAFDQIDADWGSFDNYLSHGLGLSGDDLAQLRATLLE